MTELRYYPFGAARYNANNQVTTYRFTGQRWDSGTALYFYQSRWYDPIIGRFLAADTIMNTVEIITGITVSHLLAEYVTTDECLRTMITALSESPTSWEINKSIIASSSAVPAPQMERTFRIRLSHIPQSTTPEVLKLTTATQQLIDYCSSNPTSGIAGVIFNCSSYSYSVFCGITGEKITVICVMVGPSIPSIPTR